jgi:branched-chain amino acid transport system ATP-binding protein
MIKFDDLQTYFGDSHMLHGVAGEIPPATAVGLLGRNGMDKTTLIRTLMGYVHPARGRVQYDGRDAAGLPLEKMARLGIGYVPEGRGIFPNLSVRENLVMAALPGLDGTRAWTYERVLATFPRLAKRLNNGGEQQMLSIGRALMTNPRLLILDEATEGLAPLIVAEIWRVIAQIRTTGIATLIVDGEGTDRASGRFGRSAGRSTGDWRATRGLTAGAYSRAWRGGARAYRAVLLDRQSRQVIDQEPCGDGQR